MSTPPDSDNPNPDSNNPNRSKFAITAEDFVRFLEKKTTGASCPACGTDDWTLICPADDFADAYRLVTPLRDGGRSLNLSTFAIYCDSCGFVRQHFSRVVRTWVQNNPIDPELDFEPQPDADDRP